MKIKRLTRLGRERISTAFYCLIPALSLISLSSFDPHDPKQWIGCIVAGLIGWKSKHSEVPEAKKDEPSD